VTSYKERVYDTLEPKPYAVTRGIPFIIDSRLTRLRRLARELDRCVPAYKGPTSCTMIFAQYMRLYSKVFSQTPLVQHERKVVQ